MSDPYYYGHMICKILSANDVGLNGAHQSGILIPKREEIISFFPNLGDKEKNPRVKLLFTDIDGSNWTFFYIYYNSRLFGGTRNEYRLTCMTPYIKKNDLTVGDKIIFSKDVNNDRLISCERHKPSFMIKEGVVRLGSEWKVLKLKER